MILIAQTVLFILIFVRPLGGDVMYITVTITVDLNVLQNASKCTNFKGENTKNFSGEGAQPPPQTPPTSRTHSKPHFWLRACSVRAFCFVRRVCLSVCLSRVRSRKLVEIGAKFCRPIGNRGHQQEDDVRFCIGSS